MATTTLVNTTALRKREQIAEGTMEPDCLFLVGNTPEAQTVVPAAPVSRQNITKTIQSPLL